MLAGHRFGIDIAMRVLPDTPPTLESLGIEAGIAAAWDLCRGLTLVTGVPGSGKSTLLAAGTRRLLESGAGRVHAYEAPIEFVFDGIGGDGALMSSSEVPRHFASFAEGLRSSLRRRPAAVIVGEARDRETADAVIRAADFGIAVFATTHTVGVAAAIRRLLAEFPADERHERGAALIDVMTLVATQMLLPNPRGGRTAIREWLRFDGTLKGALLEAPQERWPTLIADALHRSGNDLAAAAGRAFREGRIGEADWRRVRAQGNTHVHPRRHSSGRSAMIEAIARIRIELQDLEPKIRRRIDVPLSSTLAGLHDIIQIAFRWTDSHLHEFTVGGRVYGVPSPEDDSCERKVYKTASIRLKTVVERGENRFLYLYDFGDDWRHDVIVEEVRDGEGTVDYPAFVDGARRCPPEDIGGAGGFMDFLEAVLDSGHEEHRRMIEWYGGPFDPPDIDERTVRMLLEYAAARRRGPLASHRRGRRA